MKRKWNLIILFAVCLTGCVERKASTGFRDVESRVSTLLEKRIDWEPAQTLPLSSAKMPELLLIEKELSVDAAVQIALLKNATLQATFEDLGIAEADMKEAGALKNPVLGAHVRFPDRGPSGVNNELTIAFDFIDMLLVPMRKRVEAMRFDAAKTRVTFAVVSLASDVRLAYYEIQSEETTLAFKKDLLLAAEAASEFSQKVIKAGNSPEFETLPRVAQFYQAKLDLRRAESSISSQYEKLSRLMGVSADEIKNKIKGVQADLAADHIDVPALEAQAVANRLDLETLRQELAIIDKARALRHWGVFTAVELGASSERDPDGVRVTGPTLQMELPIFNRGQADRARLLAQWRQTRAKLSAMELAVKSEVREAAEELSAAQMAVEEHRKEIGPLRARIVELAQARYNNMTLSPLELIGAKQEQLNSKIEEIEAVHHYWSHRVELERAIGGRLDAAAATSANRKGE